jgi:predicted nuclease with TOPRIM domain
MIGYQDKINQILRGAETIKNMNDDIDLELSVSVLTKTLKDVQLERDALWVKTQEDEREINQLRDAIDQWKKLKKDWEETAHKYSENVSYWRSKHEVLVKVIVENTPIPKVLIPILREFPEIVQSAITPVSKGEVI